RSRRDAGRDGENGRAAQPAVSGFRRARHGLRPRRLLQLRRPHEGRRWADASCAVVPGRARAVSGSDSVVATVDLSTHLGSLVLKNPIVAASGCFGYGVEYADVVDLSTLGAIVVKGLFLTEREGHAPPRIVETPAGMLNAIGLQGIGVHRFVDEKLPE